MFTVQILSEIGQNRQREFWSICWYLRNSAVILFSCMSLECVKLKNDRVFNFFFFELLLQRKLSFISYTLLKWFGGLWTHLLDTRPKFCAFETSLKFGFFECRTLRRFCTVFLFDFSKWNSTLCSRFTDYRIYNQWKWLVL